MLNNYSGDFAEFYELLWADYIIQMAPQIRWLLERLLVRWMNPGILDLGCGSGELALSLVEYGDTQVVGVDLSADMVALARQRCADYMEGGRARFLQGDIRHFSLDQAFGVVTATYCVLNHFEDMASIRALFGTAFDHLDPHGVFYFDVFTRAVEATLEESEFFTQEAIDPSVGIYYSQQAGWIEGNPPRILISVRGFKPDREKYYKRFYGGLSLVIHDPFEIEAALADTGFEVIAYRNANQLTEPVDDPQQVEHLAVLVGKSATSFRDEVGSSGIGPGAIPEERYVLAPRVEITVTNGVFRIGAAPAESFLETTDGEVLDVIRSFVAPRRLSDVVESRPDMDSAELEAMFAALEQFGVLVSASPPLGRLLVRSPSSG